MKASRIRTAVEFVAEKLRKREDVSLADASVGDDLEGWLEDLAVATIRKDARQIKRTVRETEKRGAALQLALPGMDDSALPLMVFRRDESGDERAVPALLASLAELDAETRILRRQVAVADSVVAKYEATITKLRVLGCSDDMTGAEIQSRYSLDAEDDQPLGLGSGDA